MDFIGQSFSPFLHPFTVSFNGILRKMKKKKMEEEEEEEEEEEVEEEEEEARLVYLFSPDYSLNFEWSIPFFSPSFSFQLISNPE